MSKVCTPFPVPASQLIDVVKKNNKRIRLLKENLFREDSEFCVFCMTYLFTDTPDGDCTMCDRCAHCFCVSCSKTLGMYQEDGLPVDDTCLTCYLGIPNCFASGDKKLASSEKRPFWLDTQISLVVPKWQKQGSLNEEKGRCARCYLDLWEKEGEKSWWVDLLCSLQRQRGAIILYFR